MARDFVFVGGMGSLLSQSAKTVDDVWPSVLETEIIALVALPQPA
jgi:hypothetical protein